jgi:hypothetical protein
MAKRRKLPEEDLEAAVAELLSSPITRANLNFLKPEFATETKPAGLVLEPTGSASKPTAMGVVPKPLGVISASPVAAWAAEHLGSVFDSRRVRPIRRAIDVLSAVELSVYKLLWCQQPADPVASCRIAQFSLNRISIETKVNIKTVRELLPRLSEKGFIEVATEANARRGIPTTYRVWSEPVLLERIRASGRSHFVKTGKGVFYAHPVGEPPNRPVTAPPMGVATTPMPVEATPMGDGQKPLEAVTAICRSEFGAEPDSAELASLLDECHARARAIGAPLTEADLVYFAQSKARVIARASNIRNHFAVLRKALLQQWTGE